MVCLYDRFRGSNGMGSTFYDNARGLNAASTELRMLIELIEFGSICFQIAFKLLQIGALGPFRGNRFLPSADRAAHL
jgi:hypothetical protein